MYCADIDECRSAATAHAICTSSRHARGLALDVTSEAQWADTMTHVLRESGPVDVLVNSAGISFAAPVTETTLEEWRRVFAVNVEGVFLGTRHAVHAMAERGGVIVNVSSAAGIRAAAGASAYATSKAAVGMFTRVVAKECLDRGWPIRVNAVAPAAVKTPLWRTMGFFQKLIEEHGSEDAAFEAMARSAAGERFASAEEVARVIGFLCSPAAALVTGVELPADGGFVL